MERIKNYSKQELCDAVYHAVARGTKPMSRTEICEAIGRKKSAHIVGMIQELARGGWLNEKAAPDKFGRETFYYTVGQLSANCEEIAKDRLTHES